MNILFGIILSFIHSSQCQTNFLFTSTWYGSPNIVSQAQSQTIGIYACLPTLGFKPWFITNGLSVLSTIRDLTAESSRLTNLNMTFFIGEENQLINFIYPMNRPELKIIGPMYPNDDELMDVVLRVFSIVSGSSPNSSIMVIINRTQDYNNLLINNYENIISYINKQNWNNVKFVSYINVENIIYNLRKQSNFIIISLLYDPDVNKILIQKAFLSHLMVWKYKWIIVDLLGGTNVLNNTVEYGQGVLTDNVFIITFSARNLDGRQSLLQTAFNVTYNLFGTCNLIMPTLTGDFTGGAGNTSIYYIYKNPGNHREQIRTIKYNRQSQSVQDPNGVPIPDYVLNEEISINFIKLSGFRIGFIDYPPFSMMNGTNYTGFMIELLTDVLSDFNITPLIIPVSMDQIGTYNPSNLSYTGFLEYVQNGIFDTVSIPAIVTIDRLNNFDFVTNILTGSIVGMYKNTSMIGINSLNYYVFPFEYKVWITLLCSAVAIALSLALTDFIYPDKYARYKLLMSLFFSISSLTHGAYFDPPRRTAGRIIMCFWWLFCLFAVVIWASNYTALLAKQITEEPLSSIFSLLQQNTKNYTTVRDSVVLPNLNSNPNQDPQLMKRIMLEEILNGTLATFKDGIDLIMNKEYVFIGDDKSLANYKYQNCLATFGSFLSFNYGIVMPKFSEKTLAIRNKIAAKAAEGKITLLTAKYFPMYNPDCTSKLIIEIIAAWIQNLIKTKYKDAFNVKEMISVFVVIIVGSSLTLILALLERLIRLIIMKSEQRRNMYKYETTVEQLTQF